jgi:hypothetical protein
MANEKCDAPDCNLKNLNCHHTAFIMESNDAAVLRCLRWAIVQHLDILPSKLIPTFRKIQMKLNMKK